MAEGIIEEKAFGVGEPARAARGQLQVALTTVRVSIDRLRAGNLGAMHLDASLATPLACLERHAESSEDGGGDGDECRRREGDCDDKESRCLSPTLLPLQPHNNGKCLQSARPTPITG